MYVFLVNIVGIWCAVMLHLHEYYFYSDHEAPGLMVYLLVLLVNYGWFCAYTLESPVPVQDMCIISLP